jgi:hypothetical protein
MSLKPSATTKARVSYSSLLVSLFLFLLILFVVLNSQVKHTPQFKKKVIESVARYFRKEQDNKIFIEPITIEEKIKLLQSINKYYKNELLKIISDSPNWNIAFKESDNNFIATISISSMHLFEPNQYALTSKELPTLQKIIILLNQKVNGQSLYINITYPDHSSRLSIQRIATLTDEFYKSLNDKARVKVSIAQNGSTEISFVCYTNNYGKAAYIKDLYGLQTHSSTLIHSAS